MTEKTTIKITIFHKITLPLITLNITQ